jgi:hydrogenase maturation protein HypF
MELERLARGCDHPACARAEASDVGEVVRAIVGGTRSGVAGVCLARQFHAQLAGIATRALVASARESGAAVLGLSGGVFQNRLFTADCLARLAGEPWPVLRHRVVPANDGGLSLGQALAGHLWTRREGAGEAGA